MAERLKTLIVGPELRDKMGKEGRKYMEANYDHEDEMNRLERLFNDLMKDKALISTVPKEQQEIIRHRINSIGNHLDALNKAIKHQHEEIEHLVHQKKKELEQRDDQIRQLQAYLDKIQNTLLYRIYIKAIRRIKKEPEDQSNGYLH